MAIEIEPMGSYCTIKVTLDGFTSEQLAYELAKRHGRTAPARLADAMGLQERNAAHIKITTMLGREAPSDIAVLWGDVHIRDFPTQALLDQVETKVNFKQLLKGQLGLTVLNADDREAIGQVLSRGDFAVLYKTLLARVDPSTRYIWATRRGEKTVNVVPSPVFCDTDQ